MPKRPWGGYILITGPDGPPVERDTVKCRHCQRIVEVKPGTMGTVYLVPNAPGTGWVEVAGAYCSSCSGPTCLSPQCLQSCEHGSRHWEREMDRYEARARTLASVEACLR